MYGLYRTLLATLVLAFHLFMLPLVGLFAVQGFFILSGYLMTLIMHKNYGYSLKGKWSFALNRFLRLYPPYWFILILTVLIIVIISENISTTFKSIMYLPNNGISILENISMVYINWFPVASKPRLSPPTWALTIELFYYFLICIGASKTKKITFIWVVSSVVYYAFTHINGYSFTYRYHHIIAGSLPFSLGALIYHYQEPLQLIINKVFHRFNFVLLFILFIINTVVGYLGQKYLFEFIFNASFYINMIINSIIIIYLISNPVGIVSKKWDKRIGHYSYPIYLFHWQAGLLTSIIIWNNPIVEGHLNKLIMSGGAFILSIILSSIIIHLIEKPIDHLRAKIRNQSLNQ